MRCDSCGRALPSDARFCMECGHPVRQAGSALPARSPASYTPPHLANKILTSRSAVEGERKQVTVLFVDVKGSVGLSDDVDPEEWHRIMDRFFAVLSTGVHRFEGTINQFTGDGVMALFGAPIAHEDHAHRACHAALQIREDLRRYAEELKRTRGIGFATRMGLNSGEVIVGKIGDDLRMDYTAHGSTVGLADRLQKLADPGTAYVGPSTARLVTGFFRLRDLGEFELKGLRDRARVYELEGIGAIRTRLDLSRARGLSRFIGRDREIGVLTEALERALEGEGQVVGVVGEAGIGKSRLFFELIERCRAQGIEVRHAYGVPYGSAVPLLPALTLLRSYFGVTSTDPPAEARRKIAGTILLRHEPLKHALPLAFELLEVPDPERPVPEMDPSRRQETLAELFRSLGSRSRTEPVVIVLEDLHWIDEGTDALLAELARSVAGTATLLLVNFRPDYDGKALEKAPYQEMRLRALDDEAITELLRDLLGPDPGLAGLATRIRASAAGNPFFVEEVLHSLAESGTIEGARGAYRLVRPVEEIAIPPTIQAVLAARIDRLDGGAKDVVQTAAVIGEEFAEELLRRVATLGEAELTSALRALEAAEFIYAKTFDPFPEYAFRHPLVQEVAYRSQLAERRAQAHAAVARAIEELCPETREACATLLVHHYEEAGDSLNTARWSLQAGYRTMVTDIHEALRYYRKGLARLESVPDSPETRAMAITARAGILRCATFVPVSPEELARAFEEGKALALRSHDPRGLALLLAAYTTAQSSTGDTDSALEHAKEAIRLARETGDAEFEASLRVSIIFAYYAAGRLQEGLDYAEESGRRLSPGSPHDLDQLREDNFVSAGFRALMTKYMGRPKEAARDLERAIRVGLEQGKTFSWMLASLVDVAYLTGDTRSALTHGRAAVEGAEAYGSPFFTINAYRALGLAHLLDARWEEATESLEHALTILRESRTSLHLEGSILSLLAEVSLGRGDARRALDLAEQALTASRRTHARMAECLARLALARALGQARGAAAAAEIGQHLSRLSDLIEETGARSYTPFLHVERAELARLAGEDRARVDELRAAHGLFTEMGAPAHAARVSGQLS